MDLFDYTLEPEQQLEQQADKAKMKPKEKTSVKSAVPSTPKRPERNGSEIIFDITERSLDTDEFESGK